MAGELDRILSSVFIPLQEMGYTCICSSRDPILVPCFWFSPSQRNIFQIIAT
ncbi:hypothetical protein MA16_Dca019368 [Dendrobium catenatum]|uniref:Uncharacterized protein n=1 Tax=Dendrobium catenatum TaxID=906689 RepID=A0A2I0WS06_9ASPA|nr:hypothetical protein MA16_Dca019368 [Dendrobium catenatum]